MDLTKINSDMGEKQFTSNSSDRTMDLYKFTTAGGSALLIVVLLLVGLVFLCDLAVGIAMRHTKTTTFPTKLYTCMTLFCDCFFVVNMFLISAARTSFGYNVYLNSTLVLCTKIVMALSWVNVTMLLIDKVICLYYPNLYLQNVSTKRVAAFTFLTYIAVIFLIITINLVVIPFFTRRAVIIDNAQEDGPVLTCILGICLFLDIGSYFAIARLRNRHVRCISRTSISPTNQIRAFSTSRTIIVIFFVFIVVHVPLFLIMVYKDVTSNSDGTRYAVVVATLIVCCTNPALYAWRFRECRYLLVAFASKACPCFKEKAESMRIEIYNVVTSSH